MRRNRKHTTDQKKRVRLRSKARKSPGGKPKFRFTPQQAYSSDSQKQESAVLRLKQIFSWPLLGVLLLVLGTLLLVSPFSKPGSENTQNAPSLQSQEGGDKTPDFGPIKISTDLLKGTEASQPPLRIVVPALSIDLPVVEAPVVGGYWELSETMASHGVGSANPGTLGNTVIFAHARDGLFGPLRKLKKGALVYVLTKDHWYRYIADEIKEVTAKQTSEVAATKDEVLTLFTCSGFLDSKRLLVTAKPLQP